MALAPAIEFRWLVAQLRKTETKIFITDFIASNPELMTQALGALFINNAKHQTTTDALNVQCNKTISTIIQSRDSNDADVEVVKFESLPRRLIGHCASFLDQKSYGTVCRCNRAVYLGCNTPSMLTEVSVEYIAHSDKLPLDLSRFPFATNLKIIDKCDIGDDNFFGESGKSIAVETIIASQIAKMTRLQSLDLSQIDWGTSFLGIIANHQETTQRTKYLSLESEWEFDVDEFIGNITAFKHLEFLKVKLNDDCFAESDIKSIINSCRKLRGLDFNDDGYDMEVPILREIGHRLDYLKLNRANTVKGIDFADLRHFEQGTKCNDNAVGDVLRTAVNLEKVKMNGNANLIQEILTKCERLEYLEIDECAMAKDYRDLLSILDAMECGLSETEKMERHTLKIRINTRYALIAEDAECFMDSDNCLSPCFMKLDRIIRSLSRSNLNHWMLVLYPQSYQRQTQCPLFNDLKRTLGDDIFKIVIQQDGKNCVATITNNDCAICGWREQWLMNF